MTRTGTTTDGTRMKATYRPRWRTDHHPWVVGADIRYANYEIREDTPRAGATDPR